MTSLQNNASIIDIVLQHLQENDVTPRRIMVFDVPAESGGALSILRDFYDEIRERTDIPELEWRFILGKVELPETHAIRTHSFPLVKKSWLHRFFFDHFVAPRLIRTHQVDGILSFQNITIPHTNVPQILYVHQPLPFSEYRFKIRDSLLLWTYQNVIGRLIIRSIRQARIVIVQTEWLRKACIEKSGQAADKFVVVRPRIRLMPNVTFSPKPEHFSTFFYPASAIPYKNHRIIIEACKALWKDANKDYSVIFTLREDELDPEMTKAIKEFGIPVSFIGAVKREKIFEYYSRSVLLFPSYIESYGLPLEEARLVKDVVFASDCAFSHEIMQGYNDAYFFNPFSASELAHLMRLSIEGKIKHD